MYIAHTSRHNIVVNVDPQKRQTVSIMDVTENKNTPNTFPVDLDKRRPVLLFATNKKLTGHHNAQTNREGEASSLDSSLDCVLVN
jgi:hypothetical protein